MLQLLVKACVGEEVRAGWCGRAVASRPQAKDAQLDVAVDEMLCLCASAPKTIAAAEHEEEEQQKKKGESDGADDDGHGMSGGKRCEVERRGAELR